MKTQKLTPSAEKLTTLVADTTTVVTGATPRLHDQLSQKRPTGGFANPTLTALALSDELAVLTDLPGYLRRITTETGKVVSMGRTVAVSDAALLDESERPLARATATCLIINPPTKETLSTGRQVAHMRGKDRSSDGCG